MMLLRLSLSLLVLSVYFGIGDADPSSAIISIPESCRHANETEAARRLHLVCRDCESLFNDQEVGKRCRQNCFSGAYLPACVKVLYFWDEKDAYREMAEKLSGNKFVIWNDETVELERVSVAIESSGYDSVTMVHILTAIVLNVLLPYGISIFCNKNF